MEMRIKFTGKHNHSPTIPVANVIGMDVANLRTETVDGDIKVAVFDTNMTRHTVHTLLGITGHPFESVDHRGQPIRLKKQEPSKRTQKRKLRRDNKLHQKKLPG